ncbi:Dps family protein [Nesterenkonia populi]|uniref:Dps family protein n=1 Tax=Nesterenkonia populi TaxID=1591087 RepID=UPI0011BE1C01|nr:DNA starvation/stationary phase protection protein [Nesterenkonia populi]
MSDKYADYTVPGISQENGRELAGLLQARLHALNDLHLVLKHVHWNVVGPNFIAVHEMLDPQVSKVREFADEVAERIATLGVAPSGLTGELVSERSWADYPLYKAPVEDHLKELDKVYAGVLGDHREVMGKVGDVDLVTEDLLIGQIKELELFQWFIRSHIEKVSA